MSVRFKSFARASCSLAGYASSEIAHVPRGLCQLHTAGGLCISLAQPIRPYLKHALRDLQRELAAARAQSVSSPKIALDTA